MYYLRVDADTDGQFKLSLNLGEGDYSPDEIRMHLRTTLDQLGPSLKGKRVFMNPSLDSSLAVSIGQHLRKFGCTSFLWNPSETRGERKGTGREEGRGPLLPSPLYVSTLLRDASRDLYLLHP